MIAEKSGVQKILIDDDLIKAPVYQKVRVYPNVTSLITERDKVAYRQKVYAASYSLVPHVNWFSEG